jgi:hypothetical protein
MYDETEMTESAMIRSLVCDFYQSARAYHGRGPKKPRKPTSSEIYEAITWLRLMAIQSKGEAFFPAAISEAEREEIETRLQTQVAAAC